MEEEIKCKGCGLKYNPISEESEEEELCQMCLKIKKSSIQPEHYPQSSYEGR